MKAERKLVAWLVRAKTWRLITLSAALVAIAVIVGNLKSPPTIVSALILLAVLVVFIAFLSLMTDEISRMRGLGPDEAACEIEQNGEER